MHKSGSDLSGGERQKLSALSLLEDSNMKIGLLDEPFSALDKDGIRLLLDKVKAKLSDVVFFIALPLNKLGGNL
jgi:energy-coupling factor transporter ATP-binding protein EcfA2